LLAALMEEGRMRSIAAWLLVSELQHWALMEGWEEVEVLFRGARWTWAQNGV